MLDTWRRAEIVVNCCCAVVRRTQASTLQPTGFPGFVPNWTLTSLSQRVPVVLWSRQGRREQEGAELVGLRRSTAPRKSCVLDRSRCRRTLGVGPEVGWWGRRGLLCVGGHPALQTWSSCLRCPCCTRTAHHGAVQAMVRSALAGTVHAE